MPDTPEEKARKTIDDLLSKAGWTIPPLGSTATLGCEGSDTATPGCEVKAVKEVTQPLLAVKKKAQAGVPVSQK